MPARVFLSYAHEDEDFKNDLIKHLALLKRQSVIETWHDREMTAGDEWKGEINSNLEKADVVLLLVSADFLASDYCCDIEMRCALERHESDNAKVIPIILRAVDWHAAPFGKLLALPKDGIPITQWPDRDSALTDVARGIRTAINSRSQ